MSTPSQKHASFFQTTLQRLFEREQHRLISHRKCNVICPIRQSSLLATSEIEWIDDPRVKLALNTKAQTHSICIVLFPVRFEGVSEKNDLDTPLAPLLWIRITEVEHPSGRLKIERENIELNSDLLVELSGLRLDAEVFSDVRQRLRQSGLTTKNLKWLANLLAEITPNVDWHLLEKSLEDKTWEQVLTTPQVSDSAQCQPAAFLVDYPSTERHEKLKMEVTDVLRQGCKNTCLEPLFSSNLDFETHLEPDTERLLIPSLYTAQSSTVARARTESVTLINGDYGSGKSHTLVSVGLQSFLDGGSVLMSASDGASQDRLADVLRFFTADSLPFIRTTGGGELHGIANRLAALLNAGEVSEIPDDTLATKERNLLSELHRLHKLQSQLRLAAGSAETDGSALNRLFDMFKGKSIEFPDRLISDYQQTERRALEALVEFVEINQRKRDWDLLAYHRKFLTELHNQFRGLNPESVLPSLSTSEWSILVRLFPIWIVDPRAVGRMIPFAPSIFDVCLLDDAHKLDVSTPLPLLFRSKRCVIAGLSDADDETRVPRNEQQMEHENINQTLWNYLTSWDNRPNQSVTVPLTQVHRRAAVCINSQPKAKAQRTPNRPADSLQHTPTYWHQLAEKKSAKDLYGRIISKLIEIFRQQESWTTPLSIAVITTDKKQIEAIYNMAQRQVPLNAFTRHQLTFSTAEQFGGLERDIVLLSLGTEREPNLADARRLNDPRRLKQLLSHARIEQHIFTCIDESLLPPNHRFRPETLAPRQQPPHDELTESLVKSLASNHLEVAPWTFDSLCPMTILISGPSFTAGVYLLDQSETERNRAAQLELIARYPLPIFVLNTAHYKKDPEVMMERVKIWLRKLSI